VTEGGPGDVELIRIQQPTSPSNFRLFCFPDARNPTSYYLALSELLLPTVEVVTVLPPDIRAADAFRTHNSGTHNSCTDEGFSPWPGEPPEVRPDEPPEARPDVRPDVPLDVRPDVVDAVFRALSEWTDRPMAFFGHREGAWLAYRVAERLEQETAAELVTLFVSGRTARPRPDRIDPPALGCRIVALAGEGDQRKAPFGGVHAWRRCTSGRFDLEVFQGPLGFPDFSRREVVNLVHDQLLSLSAVESEWEAGVEDRGA